LRIGDIILINFDEKVFDELSGVALAQGNDISELEMLREKFSG